MKFQEQPVNHEQSGSIKSPEALYGEVLQLMNSGAEKEALGGLKIFSAIYPDYALAHNDLGVLYYKEGEKEKALEQYERAVQLEPNNDNFQKNLADFYYVEAGRIEEALQIYVKLLDANPTDLETLLILGQICESLKKTDDAGIFYNKVLELEPWNMDARERLDVLWEGQGSEVGGRGSEVSGQWSEVGDQRSIGTRVESAEKMYHDAQELINGNRKMDAVDALEKLLVSYPDHAFAHNDLGVLYLNEGDKGKTLHHYEKATALGPQNPVFQKNLADFYYVILGRAEEALEIYLKILEANPTDIETLLIMGHICVSLNNFDDAKVFYNRVLEIEPWNVDAREKLDQLANARESVVGDRHGIRGNGWVE